MAMLLAGAGNLQSRTSDLATVAYFVSGTAAGVLQQAISRPGLARLEGDRMALAMADQQSSIALLASKTEILAPEVDAIKFTYFDGFRWRNDWDSNLLGGMPKAIEILVELRPLEGQANGSRSSAPNVYRLLIAIPLAKPVDGCARSRSLPRKTVSAYLCLLSKPRLATASCPCNRSHPSTGGFGHRPPGRNGCPARISCLPREVLRGLEASPV
jgi:hypothetical protein